MRLILTTLTCSLLIAAVVPKQKAKAECAQHLITIFNGKKECFVCGKILE
jgi:hypothetical protein